MSCTLTEIEELSHGARNVLISLLKNKEKLNDTEYGYIVNSEDLESFDKSHIKEVFDSGLVLSTLDIHRCLWATETDIKDVSDQNLIRFLGNDETESIRALVYRHLWDLWDAKIDFNKLSDPNLVRFLKNDEITSVRFIIDNGTIMGLSYLDYI